MDNLNNIPNVGNWGDAASRLNDNFNKIKQSLTTVENTSKNNKGYFTSLSALNTAFPSPKAGQTAYVYDEASSTNYYIYNAVNGAWVTSSIEAPSVGVDIAEYTKTGGSTKTTKEIDDTKANHGYESNPKTLKEVDDDLAQLEGEVSFAENVVHDVFGRVDFSANNPILPDGFSIEGGTLVFTKTEGMEGSIVAFIYLGRPNMWKNGRHMTFRATPIHGWAMTQQFQYLNAAGVPQTSQLFGSVPNSGYRTIMINNSYESTTVEVRLRVAINSLQSLPDGARFELNDVVLTSAPINDFRGEIQIIPDPEVIAKIKEQADLSAVLDSKLSGNTEVVDATSLVNTEDIAISKYGGLESTVAGYKTSEFIDISNVYKIEIYSTVNNITQGYSPILFYSENSKLLASYIAEYTPTYHKPMPGVIWRGAFLDARYIRASYLTSQENEFYLRLYKGSDVSYDILTDNIASVNSIEDLQRNFPQKKIGQVGTFMVQKNVANPIKISNTNTYMSGYEPINRNAKISNKLTVLDTYEDLPYIYHIGRASGKIYCGGAESGGLYCADNWSDYISENTVKISTNNIYGSIRGVREMANGELVVTNRSLLTNGEIDPRCGIHISDGWSIASKTNTPVTFIIKQQWQAKRNSAPDAWNFHVHGNKILVSEYSVSGEHENNHVYYSNDFGQTFKSIYDIDTQFGVPSSRIPPISSYQHIHGCCIDPYWNRLWVFPGEEPLDGQAISYSDDEGETWTHLSTLGIEKPSQGSTWMWMKFCAGHALDTGVIMGTDSSPNGIWRFNRIDKNLPTGGKAIFLEEAKRFDIGNDHGATITHIMGYMTRIIGDSSEYPIVICAPMVGRYDNVSPENQSGLVYLSYDGVMFHEVWREANPAFRSPEIFQDNSMKAYMYTDGTIYIMTKFYDGISVRNRIIKGVV